MREIKFRGWNKLQKIMIANPVLPSGWLNAMFVDDAGWHTGTTYMQYTGLKDTEGVEIYEGDLFSVTNPDDSVEVVGKVIFDTDFAQFTIKYTNGGWAELWQHLSELKNKAREVTGNIYENPELLTTKDT